MATIVWGAKDIFMVDYIEQFWTINSNLPDQLKHKIKEKNWA